jgi:hypothetical protein
LPLLVPLASAFGVGGVDADGTGGLAGGMLILRTLSRIICRIVFRKALRNSAVLQTKSFQNFNQIKSRETLTDLKQRTCLKGDKLSLSDDAKDSLSESIPTGNAPPCL